MERAREALVNVLGADEAGEFTDEEVQGLASAGYTSERRLRSALRGDLEAIGHLRPASIAVLLSAAAPTAVHRWPEYQRKRLKLEQPSAYTDPWQARQCVPSADGACDSKVAFFAGRQGEVPWGQAPPVMLMAPEFGLVHDAAYLAHMWTPPASFYVAALQLIQIMATIHRTEEARHTAFLNWHNENFPGLRLAYRRGGSSSSGTAVHNHGEHAVEGYLCVLVEVKNELQGGDPLYQLLRYVQEHYKVRKWFEDAVICALGAPVLCLDLAGPNLLIHGVYTLHSDVMVSEALTPRLPLLAQTLRQPQQLQMLACVLAGYVAAAWRLKERIQAAAGGGKSMPTSDQQQQKCRHLAEDVLNAMAPLGVKYDALLTSAKLPHRRAVELMGQRVLACAAGADPIPALPIALLAALPRLSPSAVPSQQQGKLMFSATDSSGHGVVIKFTNWAYPEHVHRAWQGAKLVPVLNQCVALPGCYCVVAMERLGPPWAMLHEVLSNPKYSEEEQEACMAAVEAAMRTAHTTPVRHSGVDGTAVHGDLRGPNIMVCPPAAGAGQRSAASHGSSGAAVGSSAGGQTAAGSTADSGSRQQQWEVRFVDLDWAGLAGVGRYPPQMSNAIHWHPDAQPGRPLRPEHDIHLLRSCGAQP